MKDIKQYVIVVDGYRRPSRRRNTTGRYRVAAKSEKEAKELVQEKIQFGSVNVYYEDENCKEELKLPYKSVMRELDGKLLPVHKCTDPRAVSLQ